MYSSTQPATRKSNSQPGAKNRSRSRKQTEPQSLTFKLTFPADDYPNWELALA